MYSEFKHAVIKGVSTTIGNQERDFDTDNLYDNPVQIKRLKKTIGFGKRNIVTDDITTCDLCINSANKLLNEMKLKPEDFDAIISVTQTPDYRMPGNAHVIHGKMKFPQDTIAIDLEYGCSGFIYGLWNAFNYIENGMERILLLCGDTLSKVINPKDRSEILLFGDAGSAIVVEKAQNSPSYFILRTNGQGVEKMYQPAGGCRIPSSEETRKNKEVETGIIRNQENLYMDGMEIFNFTLQTQAGIIQEILEKSNKTESEIDYFLIHQANKFIVDTIRNNAKIPTKKVPVIFEKYANQNSVSIPSLISETIESGCRKEVVMQGFGIGLSWGICQLCLDNVKILKPEIYKGA